MHNAGGTYLRQERHRETERERERTREGVGLVREKSLHDSTSNVV